jgi:mRNA interferase MazF
MEKDFNGWILKKKKIESDLPWIFCHRREIWWCSLGINVGFEEDGKGKRFSRPVVVIRGFNEKIFIGVVLTTQKKSGDFYFPLGVVGDKEAYAILSQIRLIDTKRLIRKIAVLDEAIFEELKNALQGTLFS